MSFGAYAHVHRRPYGAWTFVCNDQLIQSGLQDTSQSSRDTKLTFAQPVESCSRNDGFATLGQRSAEDLAQPLILGARSRSRSMTRLTCVEGSVTEVQRTFDPSILEGQVTSMADIQACYVTDSNQPYAAVWLPD